ncbi:MAG: hypothetical protein KJ630_00175 [Proteobacteria bacterium]|nr:hypothetical protein [Pseudomonadota bacterium]
MSTQANLKTRGIVMLVTFFLLLAVIFMPVFPGKINGLDYMDNLFNEISKGSSYFIPESLKKIDKFAGKALEVKLKFDDENRVMETAKQLTASGVQVTAAGKEMTIKGDMALILKASLIDADFMFKNDDKPIADKYGFSGKQAVFNWHVLFKKIGADLTKQQKFEDAKPFAAVQQKALEPAYNYYGVKAENWNEQIALILFALVFYVAYTLWYGFGLMWLFEGLGMKIGH